MAEPALRPRFEPFDPAAAEAIAGELPVPAPVAVVLARRGIATPAAAREFLAATTEHDPSEFDDMGPAVDLVRRTIAAGGRITVHGDYDVDGICATTILVETLRSLGSDCDWFIPSRLSDGYGLDDSLPGRLAERGTDLLITVDCGISAGPLISELRSAGVEVLITDHHALPKELPQCPILHPALGYPFAGLCGAAVAAKLAEALAGEPRGQDLAALATIADAVPLLGENRRIVRQGLAAIRAAPRPGLRTLLAVAAVAPEAVDAQTVAFRLAPRLNAAGRLYRADAGVELLLSESIERGREIAAELDRANDERREIESEVVAEAQRQAAGLLREGPVPALVLAGEGWHQGVVGIAASRLVDRHRVPVLMIAIRPDGTCVGSGRSVADVDLLAALSSCADLLERFGGHAAAAGLEVGATAIAELRVRFAAAVAEQTSAGEARGEDPLDGTLAVEELDLSLAEDLEALGPFGQGNPEPRFRINAAVAEDVQPLGEDGRHARLMLRGGRRRASAVAFGAGDAPQAWNGRTIDATVRFQVNRWKGSVSARALIDAVEHSGEIEVRACCTEAGKRAQEYLGLVESCLTRIEPQPEAGGRARIDAGRRPRRPALAALAELLTCGRRVLVVTADARRRASLAGRLDSITGGSSSLICSRCPGPLPETIAEPLITDWSTLAGSGRRLDAEVVAMVDPPAGEAIRSLGLSWVRDAQVFELWGRGEVEFALACFRAEWDTRANAAAIFRALRDGVADASAEALTRALAGPGPISRTPAAVARALRVLAEVGLVAHGRPMRTGGNLQVRVVSSERTELERSQAYRRFDADQRAGESFLSQQQRRPAA